MTRHTGSHLRPSSRAQSEHHITALNHDPSRIGTLAAVRDGMAAHQGLMGDERLQHLFG